MKTAYNRAGMEREELQRLLNDGITAVKRGDRERGRQMLLRVVAEDERMEPAWLWLSAAVDDPADKLVALENVVAINPHHKQALAGLTSLRRQMGLEQAAEDKPNPPSRPAIPAREGGATTSAADDWGPGPAPRPAQTVQPPTYAYVAAQAEDDPFQCAYCGRPTDPDDTRCPHCGRGLLIAGPWRGGSYLFLVLIIGGLQLQLALLQAVLMYLHDALPQAAALVPGQETWAANLLTPAVVRAVLWAGVVVALLYEADWGYNLALGTAALDLAWTGVGYQAGVLGKLLATVNGVMAGAVLLIGLTAVVSRRQARVRLRVVLDRNLQGPLMVERRALAYAREGKWALAALHLRRAISLQPRNPELYKALGKAQARLRRYEEARRAFSSGAELDPSDREFEELSGGLMKAEEKRGSKDAKVQSSGRQ